MALTAALSGYATIFMALTYYYLKRLDASDLRLRSFYQSTAYGRWAARQSTWCSLVLYIGSLAVLGFEMLPLPAAIACACFVAVGAFVMVYTTRVLHALATEEPQPDVRFADLSAGGSSAGSSASPLMRSKTIAPQSVRRPGFSRGPSAAKLSRCNSRPSQSSLAADTVSATPQDD